MSIYPRSLSLIIRTKFPCIPLSRTNKHISNKTKQTVKQTNRQSEMEQKRNETKRKGTLALRGAQSEAATQVPKIFQTRDTVSKCNWRRGLILPTRFLTKETKSLKNKFNKIFNKKENWECVVYFQMWVPHFTELIWKHFKKTFQNMGKVPLNNRVLVPSGFREHFYELVDGNVLSVLWRSTFW